MLSGSLIVHTWLTEIWEQGLFSTFLYISKKDSLGSHAQSINKSIRTSKPLLYFGTMKIQ